MREKLEVFLYSHLPRHERMNDNEKYLFLMSFMACTNTAFAQLFLLLFHLVVSVSSLFYLYLFGFLMVLFLFLLVRKRRYPQFGILLSGIVILETLISAIYIGTNNFVIVYLLVTLIMQIIVPYAQVRARIVVIVVLGISMIALVLINHYMVPIINIGDNANTTLAFFNINLAFYGIITQLTIGSIIRDVILKSNQEKLEISRNEANTDLLTGLFNRRYADTFFSMLSAGQLEQVWCVAMLDIDDFKLLNDTHGHQAGDSVLKFVSDYIKSTLRKSDLVFRWGGEELLILLKDVDIAIAFRILDRIRGNIELESIKAHDSTLKVTVTIGVCPLDIHHIERSIDTCDRLMYKGKTSGKNVVVM